MTPEQKALAKHRFERAEATLNEAADELSRKNLRLSVNRAYSAVFYAMRALLATVDKDSSKHSGVLSLFNQHFIKTEIVSDVGFKSIQSLMDLRHEGDYQDFARISEEEARGAFDAAANLLSILKAALLRITETTEL